MSRRFAMRLTVTGPLVAETPLHVGGAGDEGDVDLAWSRDGRGRLLVPGTGLTGAWRAASEDPDDPLDRILFGGRPADDDASASLVVVDDALVLADDAGAGASASPAPSLLVRDHVGIDRYRGAAAHDVLYRRAVLPAGSRLQLWISLDLYAHHAGEAHDLDDLRARFLAHVARLRAGIELGGSVTRGLGRVVLDATAVIAEADVRHGGVDALRSLLRPESRPADEVLAGVSASARTGAHAAFPWRALTPVVVRASIDGEDTDQVPLVEPDRDRVLRLVLPGSSIKGALRSHAERIIRTVRGTGEHLPDAFLDQLADSDELVVALFGAAAEDDAAASASGSEGPWHGRGALRVREVSATARIDPGAWAEVVGEPKGAKDDQRGSRGLTDQARKALRDVGLRQRHHVAIDRWTGGASEGALYSELVPEPGLVDWEPIRLEVDLPRLEASGRRDAALALLWLVLRDLAAGRVPIGAGVTRGLGSIEATEPVRIDLDGTTIAEPPEAWRRAWRAWIDGAEATTAEVAP